MTRNATLAVLIAALAARSSHAQPTPPSASDDARQAEARAYFERGVAHYKAGKYLEARAEFAAGYELSHKPLFLFNMAECSRLDGNLELAREGYERYLRDAPNGSEAALAKQRLAGLAKPPAHHDAPPAPAPTATAPTAPATHHDAPPPPATVAAPPPAPPPTAPAPAMRHDAPPPAPATAAIPPPMAVPSDAPAPATTAIPHDTPDPWPQKRILAVGIASAGVAFIATGIVYWRRSVSLGDEATAACANGCDWNAVKGTYDSSQSASHAQWAFLGLGTAALAAGGYLYWQNMQEQRAHSTINIAPQPNGAAVTWSGSW